jgi:hypothetical protein
MRIVESFTMTESIEDWSKVRSPSRARRRQRYGHRQNVVMRQVPRKDAITIDGGRTYHMHPETAREFRRMMDERTVTHGPVVSTLRNPILPVWGGGLLSLIGNS